MGILKTFFQALVFLAALSSSLVWAQQNVQALFSPYQGKQAFQQIYSMIESAREKIYGSIYSWSDSRVDQYMLRARKRGVEILLVLHPSTAKKPEMQQRLQTLSRAGVVIKQSFQGNHEKFFIVDNIRMYNGSANLSGGAQRRYNENIIYANATTQTGSVENSLIRQFRKEFFILYNSARDLYPQIIQSTFLEDGKELFDANEYGRGEHWPLREGRNNQDQMILFSSSMNLRFAYQSNPRTPGQFLKIRRLGTWTVRDQIIKLIRGAQRSIYMNMNHVFLKEIMDELLKAGRRGIKVFVAVDNQEFRDGNWGSVFTPYFVDRWRKNFGAQAQVPVRVKYYSHHPHPNYWYLNHHKYFMADPELGVNGAKVLTGSYNLSFTAEQRQFDNQILIKGPRLQGLINSFVRDFQKIWRWGRTADDRPNDRFLNLFLRPVQSRYYRLHVRNGVSLTWAETEQLRNRLRQIVPGLFRLPSREHAVCTHFDGRRSQFIAMQGSRFVPCRP